MKKTLLLISTFLCFATWNIQAASEAKNGGVVPPAGLMVGGVGADGVYHFLLVGNDGSLNVSSTTVVGTGTLVSSTAYEASHVLKSSAGTLILLVGYNSSTSDQFIQLFNSTTVPADIATPVFTAIARAGSNFSLDIPVTGMPFTTGIAVSNSSTGPTKTIGSANCYFTAVVK